MRHKIRDKNLHVNTVTVFALVLLSPLPFLSPFSYDVQPVQALTFNNSPPSQESLPILPTNVDNIGLIDIKFTPSLDPTANLHNDTDTGFFFNFISSISAIDIGDSVFVMTAAKTYDDRNIQFLNVTDPESIYANSNYNSYRIGYTEYENYNYALAIDTHPVKIDNFTYALVIIDGHDDLIDSLTSPSGQEYGNAIQILNITDLSKTTKAKYVSELNNTVGLVGASHAATVEIDGFTYALITSTYNHNVQIANITNVSDPDILFTITDGNAGYNVLGGASGIAAAQIDGSYYALVASIHDGSLTIINITNPASPSNVSAVINSTTYPRLYGAYDVASVEINNSHYALVASGTDSLTIINITNPALPSNVSTFSNDTTYSTSTRARGVSTVQLDGSYYAMITSQDNDGVQMINISIPSEPDLVYTETDELDGYTALAGAKDIATIQIKDANYSFVSSFADNAIQVIQHTFVADPDTIPIIITSNNTNKMYAKAGDNITVQIKLNATALNYNVSILNETLSTHVINSSTVLNASVIVPDYTIERNAMFNITVGNNTNNLTITENDLRYTENVFVDTVSPNITLLGDADYSVHNNTTPTIPGANATDTDPNYSGGYDVTFGGYNVTSSNMVDTSTLGSVNYTYTAHPDSAGNLGKSINRTITVVASPPINIESLLLFPYTGTPYLKKDDQFTISLVTNSIITNDSSLAYGTNNNNTHVYPDNATRAEGGGSVDPHKTVIFNPTIPAGLNGIITFSMTVTSNLGRTEIITQDDISSFSPNQFITADTISPTITLNGNSTVMINVGDNYTDAGANVTDNDQSYSNMVTSNASNVNSDIAGTYIIVYSADSDRAGNQPKNVTRTVTVIPTPINIISLNITSSSGNNFANIGKIITVALDTNSTDLGNFAGTLLDRMIEGNTTNGGSANFTTTVKSGDAGNAEFSITMTNSLGAQIAITNDNITDGSFVTIDTVKPNITLNGSSTDTVLQGNNYTDLGANVSDLNNPLYNEIVTASITNLNTSSLGAQNITYSAPADAAGNIPDSINRTVTVLAKPLAITTLTITSSNANSSYAKADDLITLNLVANGTLGSATTVSIASNTITPTITTATVANDTLTASYTVESSLADTNSLAFTITTSNEDNLQTVTSTEADFPNSSIIIDNTIPTIEINGDDPLVFYTSRSSSNTQFDDPGAVANDLSYGNRDIVTTVIPDISVPGTFTLDYKAPDDYAGNTGPTVTRTLTVQDAPPINITTLTIVSDASNTAYAKAGDTLSLKLVVNDTISTHNVQILNASITSEPLNNKTLDLEAQVSSNDTESYASFTITVTNLNGTILTVTDDNITGSNVFIDTIPPRIELVNSTNYSVINGTENPIIPNVTITDGDPNYSGNFTLDANATVDATIIGSVYNYTYTADTDTAGNPGDSVSRIITIVEADPINITSLSIASSSGDNFANASKTITVSLETDGTDLGNFTGTLLGRSFTNTTSGGSATFTTTVLANDTNGNATFTITVTNSSRNRITVTNYDEIIGNSFVTIDTVKPNVTLNGSSTDTVLQGNNYTDLGANVSDLNNPLYNEIVTASITNLNTSSLGAQNITYSAPADAAGNIPDSINRTVTVLAKPLAITTLTITSSNANSSYAKADDLITLNLVANGTLGSATTVSIASNTITPTITTATVANDTLTASYTVESSLADTNSLAFTITTSNEDNLQTVTSTEADFPNSSIIIDNTIPTIEINGDDPLVFYTSRSSSNTQFDDPGAVAKDLSYGNRDIVTTVIPDISVPGTFTLDYKAPDDYAGNTGPTVTRTLTVQDAPPINITTLTIVSGASNTAYAKAGDTLSLKLVVNDTISTHNVQILNASITSEPLNNKTLDLEAQVSSNDTESYASFTITVTNLNGTILTVTDDNITGSNVFIDTIPPRIELVNSTNYSVINGTENPIIPNVTITDGDPNYSGNFTLDANATVDATIIGSVYNYTYTADTDTAGNPGDSVSRIITIVEADPINITSLSIASSSGDNFANASKTITVSLETDGTDLGNFTGTLLGRSFTNTTSGGSATFTTTVLANDTNGNATFTITVTNSSRNRITVTNYDEIIGNSFVTIDTVKPNVTLNGSSTDTVLQGNNYTDLGANVSDLNNPLYNEIVTASITNLNTSSLGAQNITYSAPADAAGNIPDSINRTVTVLAKPLAITTLTITSSNANSSYAKADDLITLNLVANGTLGSATTVSIASNTITPTITTATVANDTLTASYTVESSLADTNSLAFTITTSNEDNLQTVTSTEADFPNSSIIIDNTIPTIEINGDDPLVFYTSRSSSNTQFDDPGAVAKDLSYGNRDIVTTVIPDISVPGTFTLDYKAPDDYAGNTGPTVTRTLTVQDAPPINITTLTIVSGASNTAYAKAGDTLSLKLVVNDTISTHNVQILNASITSEPLNNKTLDLEAQVSSNDTESYASFTITVTNLNGTILTVTDDNITGSNVFIDTIPPRIELVNSTNYSVINGTENPIIPNVTITDGDPNYSGNFTLDANATVDATIIGSVYNYTYTADTDTAGNPGDSVSRIITIVEADPINITSLSIASSSGDNFANASKTITVSLETDGTDLGNFTGTLLGRSFTNTTSGGSATFTTTVLANDTNGNATFTITVTNSSRNRITVTNYDEIIGNSFVTIDTVKPNVTLNGSSTDTVLQGNNYTDLGANVSDLNNPLYNEIVTASITNLNTSSLGAQNITYSAPADAAGNIPDSINRTVTVLAKPLAITTLTITSSNANSSYAKADDLITLNLVANGTLGSATTVSIASNTITPTITTATVANDTLTASYTVESSLADTNSLAFTITTSNEDNLQTVTSTEADFPNSSIIIDNTIPTIEINGDDPLVFYTSRSSSNTQFDDPGAVAKDLSYGNRDIVTTVIPDISVPGTFTLDYKAPDDYAGNTGPTVTRTLTVQDAPPINITTLTIVSGASNTAYAKAGDTLSLKLVVNDTISTHNVQILNASITSEPLNNKTLDLEAQVSSNDTESYASFTITVTNLNGTILTVTDDNITGSNVFIDTIPPRIELVNSTNYSVINGTENPIIPNVTITDGDPNYSGNFTLDANATVDATIIGSVYNYTYTADTDTAGNPGDSVSRIITIVEADPINITSLSIASSSGDNFANASKTITVSLETDGTDLGNFTGTLLGRSFTNTTSGGSATFTTTVLANDTNGNATFTITVTNSSRNRITVTNYDEIIGNSFVTIDTVKPNVTLNGSSTDTVLQGNNYTDLGANVSDLNNPLYNEIVTASITNLNTSSLGAQNITYSAPADAAGNIPDSINRTVTVLAKPLAITTLTITSSNANSSYAKADDLITLNLVANGTLGSATTVSIASNTITPTITTATVANDTLTASYTVESSLADTNSLAFTITTSNEDNLQTVTSTEADFPNSSIIIDNTIPTIEINGDDPLVFYTSRSSSNTQFDDPGAVAKDLSYGNRDIVTTVIPDISVPGTFTLDYKAPDDYAGNTGPTVTRTLTVQDAPPINITTLTIVSGASNTAYAKAGDTLSLKLVVNDTISTHNVQILNASITSEPLNNKTLDLEAQVSSNDTESYASFTITVTNLNGTILTVTDDNITGSNVFIDTIPPRIELVNSTNYSVINGTENPIIPNVTITDGDPNYSGNFTLDANATVDATIIGSVYNYTYTADTDTAGNPGDSVSRIITIVEADPINITSLSIASSSGDNFANASKTITVSLETDGTDLGNFTGTLLGRSFTNTTSGGSATFTTTVLANDTNGNATFTITVTNSSRNRITVTNYDEIIGNSFVIIDTVSPTITLNGENNTFVALGEPYPYPGATASDISYENDMQISANSNLNVNQLGNHTLTYTAPTDLAGNLGQTITRTVTVSDSPPIDITTLTIERNDNNNAVYANEGDELTMTLVINYTIASYTATILDMMQPEAYPNSSTITLTITVPSDPIEKNATFSVTVLDVNGLPNIITQNNLTSSNIFVDTISPRINLIGAKTYVISPNSTNPSIPDAVVTDGDPNYPDNKTYTTITNGTLDTSILNSVILYTYTAEPDGAGNPGSSIDRTVIVKNNPSSSSSSSPTIGKTSSGSRIVTNGFEYNGLTVNVDRYHTEFPLIGTNVGDINTIKMKIHDSAGPTGIKRVEFALGVPDVGLYHEAETFVEVWMQRDNITVQEIIIIDDQNLLENSHVSATVSQIACSEDGPQCMLVELQYSYREPPTHNTISIKPVNWDNNAHQFYFNDGIHVDGDSINLPKEIDISASHATSIPHASETIHLVQIDRAEHLWIDQYGYQWKIIGNTIRQITVPEYLVPDDDGTYGILHGPDRNHPEFTSSVYAEQKKAQETLAEILGHTTIIKPLPESGGTIYFDATGTDSRSGDSFKLLLELETTRMQQLSNLLYDDSS